MFDRLSRSWGLVKASASVLREDTQLLLFPLVSFLALIVVVVAFAVPVIGLGLIEQVSREHVPASGYVVAFLFYFVQYFVIFFFNAGLVGAAMMRLEGGNPTFADGMRIASSKVGVIAGYAAIAATVGVILRAIQERVGFIGRIIVGLLGVGWTIATYLVVPVLVANDVGPIDAVKQSAGLLKKTWGENIIGQVGIAAAFGLIFFGVIVAGIVLVVAALFTQSIAAIVASLLVAMLAVALTALVQSALAGIYEAALYRYATTGEGTLGFDKDTLQLAFRPKKK
jgi:hypothetical protein